MSKESSKGSGGQMRRREFLAGMGATWVAVGAARGTFAQASEQVSGQAPVGEGQVPPGEVAVTGGTPAAFDPAMTLWHDAPAADWRGAYPIGNGRLGGMVVGGVRKERIFLNEDTLYSEAPASRDLSLDIAPRYDEVVRLIESGHFNEAEEIVTRNWGGRGQPCYQPLGTLVMETDGTDAATGYIRTLMLDDAVVRTSYMQRGLHFTREVFSSAPDDAIVYRLAVDREGFAATLRLESPHPTALQRQSGDRELVLEGQLPGLALRRPLQQVEQWHDTWKYPEDWNADGTLRPDAAQLLYGNRVGNRGLLFAARLRVLRCNGTVHATDACLRVEHATELVVALTMASNFEGFDKQPRPDPAIAARRTLAPLNRLPDRADFATLRARHIADHRRLFRSLSLSLGTSASAAAQPSAAAQAAPVVVPAALLPTSRRREVKDATTLSSTDPTLPVLYFQYGRYLLIASSRKGTQAANLQGIWNVDRIPPWASAYTTNINLEMNYWGAHPVGLGECQGPLVELIRECTVTGAAVARNMYHRPGWVLHHNTSIWRDAQPVDNAAALSFWPMGSGWLCQHLWEEFRYTGDTAYLRSTGYPAMRGAAEFYDAWLIEDGGGHLTTPVSSSPENRFLYTDAEGRRREGGLSQGCTLDIAILRELFANTAAAARVLGVDAQFATHLEQRRARLRPYAVGSRGQLLEFSREYPEVPPRHDTSPLFPLFPGTEITPRGTPALAAAERVLLVERAKRSGGWPEALLSNAWTRFGDGDAALAYLQRLITHSLPSLLNGFGDVFQIDGNLGGMAAVPEMLVQSHTGEVELLPALPAVWSAGEVSGLRTRGGYTVGLRWSAGKLLHATITAQAAGTLRLRYGTSTRSIPVQAGTRLRIDGTLNVKELAVSNAAGEAA